MSRTSTNIEWRREVAEAVTKVHRHHDADRDVSGQIECPHCRSPLIFTIEASGRSRGKCLAAACIRWAH